MLALATTAAVAALVFGILAMQAKPGQASPFDPHDRGGVGGALSYRAEVVRPPRAHRLAVEHAFARAHLGAAGVSPAGLREATHRGVLWALAHFTLPGGEVLTEHFSWTARGGWRDLGTTRARCPSVPSEVRSAWGLTRCQTAYAMKAQAHG
jgi:hypothetical protein